MSGGQTRETPRRPSWGLKFEAKGDDRDGSGNERNRLLSWVVWPHRWDFLAASRRRLILCTTVGREAG